jgi:DnaJ-class molecular chaperone
MRSRKVACEVTMEECYNGKTAKLKVNRQRNCLTCHGKGGAST